MGYIYQLLDENGLPFYVGKTVNLKQRLKSHFRAAAGSASFPSARKIRKLMKDGYEPQMVVIEEVDDAIASDRERYHIKTLRESGIPLVNVSDGGDGGINKEIAKKVVATRKRNGYRHSEETKRKLSEAHKGKTLTDEHRAALSRAWSRTPEQWAVIGPKISQTATGRSHIKRYTCVSPEGETYVTDRGLAEFCREHGLSRPKMCGLANGKVGYYRGWECSHTDEGERAD